MGENKFFKLTSGWCYDREFGFGFLAKRKNDEEPELVEDGEGTWDIYESDGEEGLDNYSEYVLFFTKRRYQKRSLTILITGKNLPQNK